MAHAIRHLEHEHEHPDSWHAHSPAEGTPQEEHGAQANAFGIIAGIAFFGVVTLVVSVVVGVYLASYTSRLRAQRQETITSRADYNVYRAQSDAALSTAAWINPAEGTVAIPIDIAKRKVIAAYAER